MARNVDLNALTRGDRAAWAGFVDAYGDLIKALVARTYRRHRADAGDAEIEDVVQDVFLRLAQREYRLLKTYDPARAAMSTWLGVLAHSAAIDALRKLKPTAELETAPEAIAPPERDAERIDLPAGVLTDRQVAILRLLYDQDMTPADAAGLLRISEQTVRSAKHKALTRLRDYYRSLED